MRQKAESTKPSAEKVIKDIRRVTRKQYGAEEKIDFTYLKVIGWGWFYLSTILDDFSWLTSSPGSCARP